MLRILLKIDRVMAWLLMLCMVLFFISGYGLTKGIIDRGLSKQWHCEILVYSTIITFGYHSAFAAHLSFRRWKVWNTFMKWVMVVFYAAYLGGFVYVHHFYKRPQKAQASAKTDEYPASLVAGKVIPDRVFTLEELATKYDGKDGRPAYDAVKGLVFDMTTVYKNGMHYEHKAGRDNTKGFYDFHTDADMAKYPIMGRLKK